MNSMDGAADGELLEFLGSVDSEGEGWSEYLEGTDVGRVAASQPVPPPPARSPPASPPSPPVPPVRAPQAGSQP
ncbi:MAG: hypothetical protein IT480_09740 [Gammaproteobacteria bacterium]|nr:hypothetical protein [Gammaproteobacteria bacterium]